MSKKKKKIRGVRERVEEQTDVITVCCVHIYIGEAYQKYMCGLVSTKSLLIFLLPSDVGKFCWKHYNEDETSPEDEKKLMSEIHLTHVELKLR